MKDNHKKRKIYRRILIIVLALLVLLAGAGYGIGSYFVNYALSPSSSSSERNVEGAVSYTFDSEEEETTIAEAYLATTSPVSIESTDGLSLHADMTEPDRSGE